MVLLVVFYSGVVAAFWYFRRELFLVSIDRDLALSMGKKVWVWDLVLYAFVGMTISLGVLTVGPLLTFAFLLIPPMIAFQIATRFHAVPPVAAFMGGVIAFAGVLISYFLDWPTAATDALLGCLLLGTISVINGTLSLGRANG